MDTISDTTARANLASIMQKVCEDGVPVTINHENQPSVVLLSLSDYNSMQETAYLLSQRANAARLFTSITELENH